MANTTTKKTTSAKKPTSKAQSTSKERANCQKGKNCTEFAQECCSLTDFDIASDVLGSHKALIKLYGTALCEIDCTSLRSIVNEQMSECAEDQLDVFTYMNARGMYKTEPAPVQKVKEARQKFCSTANKMEK